jgi:aspartyl/glutamyl-tRNA(Asn/Gln) amidotransferase C subunit
MPTESSPVRPEIVRQVADLARLRVPDEDLERWTRQLGRIVSYIDQLKQIPEEAFRRGEPRPTPLRADEPRPGPGLAALETNAPRLAHSLGVVPRVVGGRPPSEGDS